MKHRKFSRPDNKKFKIQKYKFLKIPDCTSDLYHFLPGKFFQIREPEKAPVDKKMPQKFASLLFFFQEKC